MKEMPASYRPWVRSTTVGAVIWNAQQEVVSLARECFGASRKMTAGWAAKAEEFQTAAENLAAIATMRLQGVEGYAVRAENEVFSIEEWSPVRRIPTSRWIRARNTASALHALCKHLRNHDDPNYQRWYAKLCEELEQAATELEAIHFPDMSGHNWDQPRADSGRQAAPTRVS